MNNTNPTEIDTSFIAYAADAAQSLNTFLEAEKEPHTQGFFLLAYTDSGDYTGSAIRGKIKQFANAVATEVVNNEQKLRIFDLILTEVERRLRDKLKDALDLKQAYENQQNK